MSTTIPDLWPPEIQVDTVTPLAILRVQKSSIEQRLSGLVRCEISTTESGDWHQHRFDLIASALNHYRVTLLTATHPKAGAYPVYVTSLSKFGEREVKLMKPAVAQVGAAAFAPLTNQYSTFPEGEKASSQHEFVELVRQILSSSSVRSLIDSIIARINEAKIVRTNSNGISDSHADDSSN